jgi:hypothetical protein
LVLENIPFTGFVAPGIVKLGTMLDFLDDEPAAEFASASSLSILLTLSTKSRISGESAGLEI